MEKFVPDIYQKSIFDINYEALKTIGIKCLLFDLDNTISPVNINQPDKKCKDLFEDLKDMNFKIIIVSNNSKQRVAPFKNTLNVDAAHSSKKPFKTKYQKILKLYNFKENEIACIGDQLITDVYGANRMGFTSILVNRISKNETFGTKINRRIERKVIRRLAKKGLFTIGEYYD